MNSIAPFFTGLRAGFDLPPFMVFTAMIGFGSLAKSQGLDLSATLLSAVGIYGLPGQIAMLELYATGASLLAILTGVAMANMRFLPMAVAMMPVFEPSGGFYRWRFLWIQVMSVNSWSHLLHVAPDLDKADRFGYFCGFGCMCLSGGIVGATVGWVLAGSMTAEFTLTLIFLNPAYFIFLFSTNRSRGIICSIILGSIVGPLLYQVSPDWSLPVCGLIAGTAGFLLCRSRA